MIETRVMVTNRCRLLWVGALVVMAATGCESMAPRDSIPDAIDASLEQAVASQPAGGPPPEAVSSALLPSIPLGGAPAPQEAAQRFDINVEDAPAQKFFMSLVEGTPYNMVVHPEVEGKISLHLKSVSIPEVMQIVRDVYGYEFRRASYGYEVLPARLRTRIYEINFPNMQRSGSSRTQDSAGQLTGSERDGLQRENGLITGEPQRGELVGTKIDTVQPETTFWSELETGLRAILGDAPGRSVVVNRQSGIILVRAMPHELRDVEDFLRKTQASAVRQVILEAKIIEVELNQAYQQGINWSALIKFDDKSITLGQIGGGAIIDKGKSEIAGNTGDLDPKNLARIVGTAASAFGGVFTAALDLGDFNAFIELLETQGTVHVLSSPRVATINNQQAVIKVGSDQFFVTDISSTTVTGTTTTTTPSIQLTPFFSGIALDVTPQISEDDNVILHVHPSISEVRDQQKEITIGTVTQTIPLALSTVRESDTVVKAQSGQVVVIGGLMQDRSKNDDAGVPMLARAPFIGSLFRQSRRDKTKSELVILLRPVVVEAGAQWTSALGGSAEHIEAIDRQRRYRPPSGSGSRRSGGSD
jgi:MSHA biogenesis protein MshL